MTKLNEDGLEIGKPVDWAEMRRIQLTRHKQREAPKTITRYDIDKMLKPDLVELLQAHGVTDIDGKVGELREKLKRVMFIGQGDKDE